MRFWADLGVSGFGIGVASGYAKDILEDVSTLMGQEELKRMFEGR
jgi:hypothetical protein